MTGDNQDLLYILLNEEEEHAVSGKLAYYDRDGLPFLADYGLREPLNRPVIIVKKNGEFVWFGPDDKTILSIDQNAGDNLKESVKQVHLLIEDAARSGSVLTPVALVYEGLETEFYTIMDDSIMYGSGYEPKRVKNFEILNHSM